MGSVSWGLFLIQSRILSSQPSTGDCNFRRNCCASFPVVITWFLLAKNQKPLVSAKLQLPGPGGSDLSCDSGLASPEGLSWGQMLQDRRWDSSVGSCNLLESGRTGWEPQAPSLVITPAPRQAALPEHTMHLVMTEQQICVGPRCEIKTPTAFSRAW